MKNTLLRQYNHRDQQITIMNADIDRPIQEHQTDCWKQFSINDWGKQLTNTLENNNTTKLNKNKHIHNNTITFNMHIPYKQIESKRLQ